MVQFAILNDMKKTPTTPDTLKPPPPLFGGRKRGSPGAVDEAPRKAMRWSPVTRQAPRKHDPHTSGAELGTAGDGVEPEHLARADSFEKLLCDLKAVGEEMSPAADQDVLPQCILDQLLGTDDESFDDMLGFDDALFSWI